MPLRSVSRRSLVLLAFVTVSLAACVRREPPPNAEKHFVGSEKCAIVPSGRLQPLEGHLDGQGDPGSGEASGGHRRRLLHAQSARHLPQGRHRVHLRHASGSSATSPSAATTTSSSPRSGTCAPRRGDATSSRPGTDWWAVHYPADQMQRPTGPLCDGCHSVNYDIKTKTVTEWNVGCEKCHGAGSLHVEFPVASTIVNPAKLDAVRADDVCLQCHSQGQPRTQTARRRLLRLAGRLSSRAID